MGSGYISDCDCVRYEESTVTRARVVKRIDVEFMPVFEYIDFHIRMRGVDSDTAKRAFKDDYGAAPPDMKDAKGPKYAPRAQGGAVVAHESEIGLSGFKVSNSRRCVGFAAKAFYRFD